MLLGKGMNKLRQEIYNLLKKGINRLRKKYLGS